MCGSAGKECDVDLIDVRGASFPFESLEPVSLVQPVHCCSFPGALCVCHLCCTTVLWPCVSLSSWKIRAANASSSSYIASSSVLESIYSVDTPITYLLQFGWRSHDPTRCSMVAAITLCLVLFPIFPTVRYPLSRATPVGRCCRFKRRLRMLLL